MKVYGVFEKDSTNTLVPLRTARGNALGIYSTKGNAIGVLKRMGIEEAYIVTFTSGRKEKWSRKKP